MAHDRLGKALRRLREVLAPAGNDTDAQLLGRFLQTRDEQAFAALVQRHGQVVLGVCRRVLRDSHLAEDAFQATFLVLARKAGSVRPAFLANWLYGVAHRTALEARRAAAVRRAKEQQAAAMVRHEVMPEADLSELQALLDEELARLPDRYRTPVVLCDLQGLTRKEAAQRLGWQEGTLSGRLFRARALLAKRLSGRGLAVSGGALAGMLAEAAAAPSVALVCCTAKAAAGQLAAASAGAVALAQGVMKAMLLMKLKGMATGLVVACLAIGAGTAGYRVLAAEAGQTDQKPQRAKAPDTAQREQDWKTKLDQLAAERDKLAKEVEQLRAMLADAQAEAKRLRSQAQRDLYADRMRVAEAAPIDQRVAALRAERDKLKNQISDLNINVAQQVSDLNTKLAQVEAELAKVMPDAVRNSSQAPGKGPPPDKSATPLLSKEARSRLTVMTYPVGELVDEPSGAALIQVVVKTVAPETWSDTGGPGTISYFAKAKMLVVRQTDDVQREVHGLLERLLLETERAKQLEKTKALEKVKQPSL